MELPGTASILPAFYPYFTVYFYEYTYDLTGTATKYDFLSYSLTLFPCFLSHEPSLSPKSSVQTVYIDDIFVSCLIRLIISSN